MVVVEVPMWVVHSGANVGGSDPSANSAAAVNGGDDHKDQRAKESLSLLEGLGGTQKSAIYSLDMHPSGKKFATGGGDGTVRLWNAEALFASTKGVGNTSKHPQRTAKYTAGGHYESSGESSSDESHLGKYSTVAGEDGSASEASLQEEEEAVRDLSSLVRRKKDGSTSSPAKTPTTQAAASTPSHASTHHHKHNPSHHRLLCTLSAHTGSSVLAVRFSTNGQYLASAGDDAVVCIYAKDSTATNGTGNLDHHSVEHWTRIKLCRGHALDAVGLAWAPDDSHLVSCSLDSNTPIIVWKLTELASNQHRPTHANVLCNPYKILGKGVHSSTVKGVTFDPAGTYLASSGDDPSVCVWRAHDDWGLEKRIDANSGIFRRWKESDSQALSSQSLFRRLSWSTDGAYICSTNAVVKNKHVASTISREGWAVSSAKSTASGAANLVGHRQPVVVCRHCPFLLDVGQKDGEVDEDEPEYATLLALGDKRGYVTIWSTRRSRPVFKLQCSETRCTVTDLAWGKVQEDIILVVSLLDGQMVALRFGVPGELGHFLKEEAQARVFQLRYGIDLNDTDMGRRRLFVGENSGPKLIENALQYTLEEEGEDEGDTDVLMDDTSGDCQVTRKAMSSADVKATQSESRGRGGKKRIQPLLMAVDGPTKKAKVTNGAAASGEKTTKKKVDSLEDAMELAEKTATGAEAAVTQQQTAKGRSESVGEASTGGPRDTSHPHQTHHAPVVVGAQSSTLQIPHSTDRIHSVDLPVEEADIVGVESATTFVADCTNSIQVPHGSKGSALPCATLSISRSGQTLWKDQMPGSSCSAIAASKNLLAIGTADGCVQLYGTSPSRGWASGAAFRSHPPFVTGRPIVALQLHDKAGDDGSVTSTALLAVSADGNFGVYALIPEMKLLYKGTVTPPMSHMLLAADMSTELLLPRLARVQLTDKGRLLLLLSLHSSQGRLGNEENRNRSNNTPSVGAGGSLQAFVYDRMTELWARVSDSRFVLSDFYSTLPSVSTKSPAQGELSKLDDSVRLGAISSTLKTSRRGGAHVSHAEGAYQQSAASGNDVATRSHCEDRMACSLALGSGAEFEFWLSRYARALSLSGNHELLRVLVDMLMPNDDQGGNSGDNNSECAAWWLTVAPNVLNLDRLKLIKSVVIPEMSKNRALQRVTNEIALEVDALR